MPQVVSELLWGDGVRPFLIFTVLLGTVFTFYSALVFKSEVIERDIDIAIKDELASADVSGVDVQTDGRHVTLTGVVYDAADEARLLDLCGQWLYRCCEDR